MKRFLAALTFALLAAQAMAQETYQVTATAGAQGTLVEFIAVVSAVNGKTCETQGLAVGCTQAEACISAGAPGGAGCSPTQARDANVRIWPQTQPGREEFFQRRIALPAFLAMKGQIVARGQERQAKYWATADAAQKKMMCNASGQSDDCLLY